MGKGRDASPPLLRTSPHLLEQSLEAFHIFFFDALELESVTVFSIAFFCRQIGPDYLGDRSNCLEFKPLNVEDLNHQMGTDLDLFWQINEKTTLACIGGNPAKDLFAVYPLVVERKVDAEPGMSSLLNGEDADLLRLHGRFRAENGSLHKGGLQRFEMHK